MVTLNISKSDLYGYVSTLVALYGRSKEDFETYAITQDNYPMLDSLIESAVSEVKKVLAVSYTNRHTISGDNLQLTLNDDAGLHDANTITLLTEQVRFALAYMLAALWLSAIEQGAGEMYAASAGSYIRDAAAIFAKRNPREAVYAEALTDDTPADGAGISSLADAMASADDSHIDGADASSMTDADATKSDDEPMADAGASSMEDADAASGDSRMSDSGMSSMADADTTAGDNMRLSGDTSIMDDGDIPLQDNVLEKPWCRHRHLLHDKDWKFISTKHE